MAEDDDSGDGGKPFSMNVFTHKVGGVPVWVWAAAGSLVLIVVFRIRASRGAKLPFDPAPSSDDTTVDDSVVGSDAGTIDNIAQPTTPNGKVLNNVDWQTQATDILIGMGHDPLEVQRSLSDYLAGITLDFAQQRLVRIAINTIGSPPEPVTIANTPVTPPSTTQVPTQPPPDVNTTSRPGIPTAPSNERLIQVDDPVATPEFYLGAPPTTLTSPFPTAPKVYTVQTGDTLSSIAGKFNITVNKLYSANVNVIGGDPNHITPGMRLVIP